MAPVMHPTTEVLVGLLKRNLPQSLLLTGPQGLGLASIAQEIVGRGVLAIVEPFDSKGHADKDGSISVDAIRELYVQTRTKHEGDRVIIISGADRMNASGQSAFLKLLEEPQPSIHFILTAHHPERLKSTIISRVQQYDIRPISTEQSKEYISSLGVSDAKKQAQLLYMAEGLPAELLQLVTDEKYFEEQAKIISDARTLLQGEVYDKLLVAQSYHSDRDAAVKLVEVALRMARRTISQMPQPVLLQKMNRLLVAHEKILGNGNVRLVLASAVMA